MFTNCCNRRDPHPLYLLPPPAWLCICTKRIQIVLLIGWLTKSDCCNFPGKGAALKKVESETHNNRTELKAQKMKMKTSVFSMFPPSREGSTALFLCRSAWGRDISVQFSHKRWAVTRGRFFPWYIWGPADPWCFRNRKRTLHKINLGENNRVLCGPCWWLSGCRRLSLYLGCLTAALPLCVTWRSTAHYSCSVWISLSSFKLSLHLGVLHVTPDLCIYLFSISANKATVLFFQLQSWAASWDMFGHNSSPRFLVFFSPSCICLWWAYNKSSVSEKWAC